MHGAVLQDVHGVFLVARDALLVQLAAQVLVEHDDDMEDARDGALHKVLAPLFQRLGQDGMVGVGEDLLADVKRCVKGQALAVGQQADELRDGDDRVGVIELDGVHLGKVREVVAIGLLVLADDILQRSRAEEVLLLEAQDLAFVG